MKRTLLWCGDAVVSSGFARATHEILQRLTDSWDVVVLGLNYRGDPHSYPYPIYPCWPGGDGFGIGRISDLIDKHSPDLIVVQNDPWNIPAYMKAAGNVPMVASMPVDGKNCKGRGLNGLALAIFWTMFGQEEAKSGGYIGPSVVIPLGIDLLKYYPKNRKVARIRLGLPEKLKDAFIVGNVNRNQPRKRLDLTVQYFAEWVHSYRISDAYLFLHVAPTGDLGYDVKQLMQYYGLAGRLILAEPDIGYGVDESVLAETYSAFDVQISTTQGEGWGLTTMEGMACGIPQIVPNWAALGEWAKAAVLIDCDSVAVTPNHVNVIGGIPNKAQTIEALQKLYSDIEYRTAISKSGLELSSQPVYNWDNVGREFLNALEYSTDLRAQPRKKVIA